MIAVSMLLLLCFWHCHTYGTPQQMTRMLLVRFLEFLEELYSLMGLLNKGPLLIN